MKSYKYYDLILGAYVCVLLCSNLIGPAKFSTVQVPLVGPVTEDYYDRDTDFTPFSLSTGDARLPQALARAAK